ncbi:MAG: YbhB/YbcL family Raf kinase inhibitor-like protein, partial [Halothece sp.]
MKDGCKGENINPQLTISNVPENTEALAMIMDDPDAPVGTFTHWTVWNIDPKTALIPENTSIGTEGANDFGDTGYGGPCPPSGTHRYFFKLYALSEKL